MILTRRRLTVGATAHYSYKATFVDFRVNFEQYFYNDNVGSISPTDNNKLVAGAILYF